jgi:hypothetical protein
MRSVVRPQALVAAWFDFLTPAQRELALALQAAVQDGAPDTTQTVRWGNLVFCVDDQLMLALSSHKTHLSLQFFQGQWLPASLGVLDSAKRGHRSLHCALGQPIDAVRVALLVAAAAGLARRHAAQRLPPDRPERAN